MSNFCAIRTDGLHKIWEIKFKPVPAVCDELAFETLFTLRAALDQAAYAAATAAGKVQPRYAYFPVAKTLGGLDDVIRGRCRDLPDEIKALFREFKPYKTGNNALWTLNELGNKVHAALVPVGVTRGKLGIFWTEEESMLTAFGEGTSSSLKGEPLAEIRVRSKVHPGNRLRSK